MSGIRATYDMFQGANGAAMLAVFKDYANTGVILSDIKLVSYPTGTLSAYLIIGYAKASECKVTQAGNPNQRGPSHDRVYEGKRHELRIPIKGAYIDTDQIIAKLALIRD